MSSQPGQIPMPEPQAVVRQRRVLNRWSIFLLIVGSALLTILYVSNVVSVNRLLTEVQQLEHSRDSLFSVNEALRVEVTRLQSAERITTLARNRLGMVQPTQAPIILKSDDAK